MARLPSIDAPVQRGPVEANRLSRFASAMEAVTWGPGRSLDAMDTIASALEELTQAEIEYYFAQRRRRRILSMWCRGSAWVFGTLGFLTPLVHAVGPATTPWLPGLGFVFLGLAASALAANTLFGGTSAHIRSTTTQIQLERTVTMFRLDWQDLRRQRPNLDEDALAAAGFERMRQFARDVYAILEDETALWGKTMLEAVEAYAEKVNPRT